MSKEEVHIHYHYPRKRGDPKMTVPREKPRSYKKEVKLAIKIIEEIVKLV